MASANGCHDYDLYLKVATEAAEAAGGVIAAAFNQPKAVEHKGAVDLVTETDKQSENLVYSHIQNAFPTHRFIGEEGTAEQGFTSDLTDEPTWMCDPLDGTTNFVHGFPFVCVSIGLAINKQVVVGVVYNPVLKELFTAVRGRGALLNGSPLRCSETASMGSALFATEVGTSREPATIAAIFDRIKALTAVARAVRCCGSCAMNMCGVAMGRLDAFYEVGFGGCWDVAAASLIVEEAGGKVLDPCGGPFSLMGRRVLATNAHLAEPVSYVLAACPTGPTEPPPTAKTQ